MVKRFLDLNSREILTLNKNELLKAIKKSESRVIVSEVIGIQSLYHNISNTEVAAAFGTDMIVLNKFNVEKPFFAGIAEDNPQNIVSKIKELTGRPIGVNLEPVDEKVSDKISIEQGRKAILKNAIKAVEQGFDFIDLTGNPDTGVSNESIIKAIKEINEELGDELIIISGKMHMAGINESYLEKEIIKNMLSAGTDILLLPMPGTVPGITVEDLKPIVNLVHNEGKLVMNAIGTSQESCDIDTIKKLALWSKMTGADIHHIGDVGCAGMTYPENILYFSNAIRGRRHTYRRMSLSIKR